MRKADDIYIDLGSSERNLWSMVIRVANRCVHQPKTLKPKTKDAMYRAYEVERDRKSAVRFFENSPTSHLSFACDVLGKDAKEMGELAMQQNFSCLTDSPD